MSKNNQLLVKEHNGKFYVFDVMAESWGEWDTETNKPIGDENKLKLSTAKGVYSTREDAHKAAHKMDAEDDWYGSEYGVIDEVLYKDGAEVKIIDDDPDCPHEETLEYGKKVIECTVERWHYDIIQVRCTGCHAFGTVVETRDTDDPPEENRHYTESWHELKDYERVE